MLDNNPLEEITFFVDDEYSGSGVLSLKEFDPEEYEVIVAVGDSILREKIVKKLPPNTKFFTFIHKSAMMFAPVYIGEGSIICAGVILTCGIKIGKHAHLNICSIIGHNSVAGDYFTTSFGTNISGNCIIGDRVCIGSNSSVRQKIGICSDVIIGLNSGVVKNITDSGVYGGVPVKKIK